MNQSKPIENQNIYQEFRGNGRTSMGNTSRSQDDQINLAELVMYLLTKWKLLLLGLLAGAVIAAGYTHMQPAMYSSNSMLFIVSRNAEIASILSNIQASATLNPDYIVIATSKPVLDTAIEKVNDKLGTTLTREDAKKMVKASASAETEHILTIKVTDEDPQVACELANAVTEATVTQMEAITRMDPPTVVEKAEVAAFPDDNGFNKNTAMGGLAGLILLIIIVTIPYLLNDKINTTEEIEKYLDISALGMIPIDKEQAQLAKKGSRHGTKN